MARKPGEMDHTDFKRVSSTGDVKEAERRTGGADGDRRWWAKKEKECADSIQSTIKLLQSAQAPRLRQNVVSMRLYGNFSLFGTAGAAFARAAIAQNAMRDRITYNAVQSIVDTVNSKIGETKPRPYFLTSGGDYRQQRKAKKLNQFTEGNFYENKTYEKGNDAFRDCEVTGDGFVFVYERGGKIRHEKVRGDELWIDETEAQYGFPRNMHRVKEVDRDELADNPAFSKHRDSILKAPKAITPFASSAQTISDMVTICESWHLGTMTEKGDMAGGRHVISLPSEGVLLESDDWEFDFFPFAKIPWCKRPLGYWSQGLCEQLQSEQIELNKELLLIQRSMHIAGSMKVFLPMGSKVAKEAFNNDVGTIINFAGDKAPQPWVPEPIHPVYFQNVDRIIERMYAKAGVSELSASGKKPAGLNSGAAQREFEDIQSDRFRTIQRQNEDFYLAIAGLDVAIAGSSTGLRPVRVPGKRDIVLLDWNKEIGNIRTDEYVMQCFSVSKLPRDPAGRLSTIQEYIQAGFMTPRQGRRALDFPDIDAIESLANAQEDLTTKILDDIIDNGEYRPPEPTDDLRMSKEMVLEYIQRYRMQGLEDEKLDLLRSWNMQVDYLLAKTLTPATAAPPMAGTEPQAPPQQPNPSELVQNTPQAAA